MIPPVVVCNLSLNLLANAGGSRPKRVEIVKPLLEKVDTRLHSTF
jgi:hypothetical protein